MIRMGIGMVMMVVVMIVTMIIRMTIATITIMRMIIVTIIYPPVKPVRLAGMHICQTLNLCRVI